MIYTKQIKTYIRKCTHTDNITKDDKKNPEKWKNKTEQRTEEEKKNIYF